MDKKLAISSTIGLIVGALLGFLVNVAMSADGLPLVIGVTLGLLIGAGAALILGERKRSSD
jgi:F0F1-type ATP synthase assembly protein I